MKAIFYVLAIGLLIGAIIGLYAGWYWVWGSKPALAIQPHTQYQQADRSTVAARQAGTATPAVKIPPNSTATSAGIVTFKPRKPVMPDGKTIPKGCELLICPAITIDLATAIAENGQPDLIVKADGAEIDKAEWLPEKLVTQSRYLNAAGLTWRPETEGDVYGVIYQRDFDRLRLGAGMEYQSGGRLYGSVQALLRY